MNPLPITVGLIALMMASASEAQSTFDGTWKVDISSAMSRKVNVWVLREGMFRCTSCNPTIGVKADGQDQPVHGQPYDTISVKVVNRQTVEEIEKKNGQTVSDETFKVSDDGNTVTDEFGNWKITMARIGKGPAGAHALSGSWQPSKIESISETKLLVTYKLEGETLNMARPTGQTYIAKLNGTDAPYKGDPDTDSVVLKRIDRNTIEETDKLNGKVVSIARMTVSADGQSMTVSVQNAEGRATNRFILLKQ